MGFSSIGGYSRKPSIVMAFSFINHSFWAPPFYENKPPHENDPNPFVILYPESQKKILQQTLEEVRLSGLATDMTKPIRGYFWDDPSRRSGEVTRVPGQPILVLRIRPKIITPPTWDGAISIWSDEKVVNSPIIPLLPNTIQ